MSAYRHLQRHTEAEVIELWEACVKRWEHARDAMAQLDEIANEVIEADRLRLLSSERDTLANGARLAETLGAGETRAINTPRLETMIEALRREEQRLESRHRCSLKLPYMPQLPDELDQDTADIVYKQLTSVETSLSWTLGELASERKRHEEALATPVSVDESRAAFQAKRHLEAIQKALSLESGKVEVVPPRLHVDRDIRVIAAPVVLLVLVVSMIVAVSQLFPDLGSTMPAMQETEQESCPSGCGIGKTRP